MSEYRDDNQADAGPAIIPNAGFETGPDRVKRKVNETLDVAEGVAARAVGGAKASRLRGKADELVDRGEDTYYGALDRLDAQIQRAPYQTLGAALAIGAVIGFLLAGNRRTVIYRSA
jgi:ElaB/YqjD/DUF883 family membrane-anchored ribosome-binding protein